MRNRAWLCQVLLVLLTITLVGSCVLLPTAFAAPTVPQYEAGKEIIGLRTENSKTYYLGKGQYQTEISGGIIHYKDDYDNSAEEWKDIDLKWDGKYLDTAPYILSIVENKVYFSDKKTGAEVSISPVSIGQEAASLSNLVIIPFNEGVKLQRQILSAKDSLTSEFAVDIKGNSIQIYSAATDADGDSVPVEYSIEKGILTEIVSLMTADGKSARFPITVDPVATIQPSSKDNYMYQGLPSTNYGNNVNLKTGKDASGSYRSLVEFDIMSALPDDAVISLAQMSLYSWATSSLYRDVRAARLLRLDWGETTSSWNYYKYVVPSYYYWDSGAPPYGASEIGVDITTAGMADATVPFPSGWATWTVTAQVQTAYGDKTAYACRLSGVYEVSPYVTQFYSNYYTGVTTKRPKLVITYTCPPMVDTTACGEAPTYLTANGNILETGGLTVTERGFCYCEGTATGWISPDSHIDEAGTWTNEANAYDENTGSYATATATGGSNYLDLILDNSITCNKVRIWAMDPIGGDPEVDIDVYYDDVWNNIFSGTITASTWVEKTIGAGKQVTDRARVRFTTLGDNILHEFDFNAAEPTTDDNVVYVEDGFGTGAYSYDIGKGDYGEDELELETSYLVRAYAENVLGTGYGDTVVGTTTEPWVPEIDTDACDEITATTMQGNADITYDGGATVTRRGFVYAEGLKYALDFSSDYVDLPNDLEYTTQVSVFAWFKHEGAPPGDYHIIFGGQELEISIPSDTGALRTGVYTTSRYVSNHGSGLCDGEEHYIGFTFDGSTKISYIDGVNVGEQPGITGALTYSFANRKMGRFGSSTTYYLNGQHDNASIWNYDLTQAEIQANMYSELTGSESGLVAYWKLNEGTGSIAYDDTSNNNDGTITGADWVYQEWDLEEGLIISLTEYPEDWSFLTYGVIWNGQTFTYSKDFYITAVGLELCRDGEGTIGTVTLGIWNTVSGKPSGGDLCSGTIDGDPLPGVGNQEWRTFTFSEPVLLEASTTYSFVTRAPDASYPNRVGIMDTTTDVYPGGYQVYSSDGGDTWGTIVNCDDLFKIWGYVCDACYEDGSFSEGEYSLTIEDLEIDTWYRVRGFAENEAGYGCGDIVTAQTLATEAPTIVTQDATSVEVTTARLNGEVTDTGGEDPTVTVFWGVTDEGTTPGSWDHNSIPDSPAQPQGTGTFYKDVDTLPSGATIYFNTRAVNSGGTGWGTTKSFLTKPAAPTDVQATDGDHIDKVVITWTKSTGATGYQVYRDGAPLGWLGDVATYDDTGADAPTITPGAALATDGNYPDKVSLSLSGQSANNGTTHTYKVRAKNGTGESPDSSTDTGYRGVGALNYQWYRSSGDSDSDYSVLTGATSPSHDDTTAPAPTITPGSAVATDGDYIDKVMLNLTGESANNGNGRYYKCYLTADGATPQYSSPDRGYKGTATLTYQWQRSSADSDADYSNIEGATTDPYSDYDGVVEPNGRYYQCVLTMTGASSQTSSSDRGYKEESILVVAGIDATGIGSVSATLGGNVTAANSVVIERGFQWGYSSGNYSSNWTESGSFGVGEFNKVVTGLLPLSEIFWRAFAANVVGMNYSIEGSFFTLMPLPSAPTDLAAIPTSISSMNVSWSRGAYASHTILRIKADEYPEDITDGEELYFGTNESVSFNLTYLGVDPMDTEIYNLDYRTYYIRAWSQNDRGYSPDYAQTDIGDAARITLIIFVLGLCAFALWKKDLIRSLLAICIITWGIFTISYDYKIAAPLIAIGIVLFIISIIRRQTLKEVSE